MLYYFKFRFFKKNLLTVLSVFLLYLPSSFSTLACSTAFQHGQRVDKSIIQEFFRNPRNVEKYKNQEGYLLFAEEQAPNYSMVYIFIQVSKALGKKFKALNWQTFHGLPKDFKKMQKKVLGSEGRVKAKYQGMEGYARFADEHYAGNMQKTFVNVSAILDKEVFKQLKWKYFPGLTKALKKLKEKVLDSQGNIRLEYQGMEGYTRFADQLYAGDMQKAFANVSAVLDKEVFKQLKWQRFQGSTKALKELKEKVLDSQGNIRLEYQGMIGYARFADQLYAGSMQKAFLNVSAILDKTNFKGLNWKEFVGSTTIFNSLKHKVLDSQGNIRLEYQGMIGYARFADEHYNGDMSKAFNNVSAILDKEVFKQLKWRIFQGSTKVFRELEKKVLDSQGNIRLEYQGMKGYTMFADQHYAGDMQKAFNNVSAVLGGVKNMRRLSIAWKLFKGNTIQYHTVINLFKTHPLKYFNNREGLQKVADIVFKGNIIITYRNISTLRHILFEDPKDFKALNWPVYK